MLPLLILLAASPAQTNPTPDSTPLPTPNKLMSLPSGTHPQNFSAPQTATNDCSKWPGFCPPLDPSAPFLRTPRVEPLGPCQGDTTYDSKCKESAWSHTFMAAAHFPIPRFTASGEPFTADGLLIYEGMKFTVYPATGHYDLSFTATAPNVPVLIRLQLELSSHGIDPIRLTLPPIVIEPSLRARLGDPAGTTVAINHRGFSAALKKPRETTLVFPNAPSIYWDQHNPTLLAYVGEHCQVRRLGTARFGSNTPTSDEYGR